MYLKRLELLGFKSFLGKTVFEFGPGVTAVIGPNGSGKSNVAESLRWVLGEQAARNVRARRLEDVIFSGSSQKAAVGMAEVSITLDNAEGWLPVDFSEVVVTRRAFRNGESEYLINKSKVRLRDVLDLFLRARVGQNSYAFLGQGLVEEVLTMRPEERRRLLEEAADVRLLRTKLDEARDRLMATRENLERVTLLIDEIGPRLQQLERQAARAADHERLARELAAALHALFGNLWSAGHEAVAAARAASDQSGQEFKLATAEVKACEEGLAALATAVEERQKELTARRLRQRDLSDNLHAVQQRLAFDRERVETHAGRRKEIESELNAFRAERSDTNKAIESAHQRQAALLPEIEEARALVASRRQELTGLEQEYAGLRRRAADHEDRIARGRRTAEEASVAIRRIEENEAQIEAEVRRRSERKTELVSQLAAFGLDYLETRRRLVEIEDEVDEAQQERTGLVTMIESGRRTTFALESESVEVGVRLAQIQARHDVLRRLEASHEGIDIGVRALLGDPANAQAEPAAEGLLGLVREIVRVPPGLERAIEAALAENVQALAFENTTTAIAAIEALQRTESGRVLVYPLDALRASAPVNIMREKGVIGVASRLVRCENRFRLLVDTLLGRTIVVETLALAQQVVRRGMGSVVTMDGTLLRPGGAIGGGLSRAATESFTRQRELEELPQEFNTLQSRKNDVDNRLRREKESLAGASAALTALEPQLAGLRDEASQRHSSLIESRARLVLLQTQARTLWAELRRSGDADGGWRAQRDQLQAHRNESLEEVRQATENLEREREALASLSARRTAAIDGMSESAAAQADLEGEGRSLARQVEMLQANLARSEAQVKGRETSLSALQAEALSLSERITAQVKEQAMLDQDVAGLASEMEPAEGELAHLVSRERSMRDQLGTARARLLEAERRHMEAEASLKIRGDEVESLRETMAGEGFRPEGNDVVRIGVEVPARGLPPIRGAAELSTSALRERIGGLRQQIRGLGPVNEQAPADYIESKERYDFLKSQVEDLQGSEKTLLQAIDELEENIRERLKATFAVVDQDFQRYFESFFAGGRAHLTMTNPDDFANSGLEIVAQPPGKRVNNIAMLSGGERALTSVALLLALLNANPSPVCVLDEVDAALDEANVGRFVEALRAMAEKTQFIVVTHNPRTIEAADVIYGVSMATDNTSRVLSVRLGDPVPS